MIFLSDLDGILDGDADGRDEGLVIEGVSLLIDGRGSDGVTCLFG